MTILYQAFLYDSNNIEYDVENIISEQLEESNKFVSELVNGVISKRDEIDEIANKYLEDWNISRLGFTDQAIIRMGIYEILWTDTPDVTCIDEAVELSKEYSDEKVCKMINGVLDKVYHSKDNND
jgi:N utilization substance protein B